MDPMQKYFGQNVIVEMLSGSVYKGTILCTDGITFSIGNEKEKWEANLLTEKVRLVVTN